MWPQLSSNMEFKKKKKKWKEYLLGILRFFVCYRCVFILDSSAPAFDLDVPLYRQQLNTDLVMNVYNNGHWGSYRHLPLGSCNTIPVSHAYVNVTTRGDLSSLKWLEGKLQPDRYVPNTEFGSAYIISIYINTI
jgi:hypothetical protein